jgi:uncharacterized protein YidB (DUF937 family)
MTNPLVGAILGNVFANAMRGRARSGPFGRVPPANAAPTESGSGLGELLGGILGGAAISRAVTGGGRARTSGNRGLLIAMMLPFALRWVQRNGGIGGLLDRLNKKGYGSQASSWISTGPNRALDANAVHEVIDAQELSQVANQLGVSEGEVSQGMAEILPELVDQLSPEGQLPPEADEAMDAGLAHLEQELSQLTTGAPV